MSLPQMNANHTTIAALNSLLPRQLLLANGLLLSISTCFLLPCYQILSEAHSFYQISILGRPGRCLIRPVRRVKPAKEAGRG
eukprot:scaffold170999_cov18-Prasinocladus_malaysianus.AAC.1